jgi:hypothetical protein
MFPTEKEASQPDSMKRIAVMRVLTLAVGRQLDAAPPPAASDARISTKMWPPLHRTARTSPQHAAEPQSAGRTGGRYGADHEIPWRHTTIGRVDGTTDDNHGPTVSEIARSIGTALSVCPADPWPGRVVDLAVSGDAPRV